MKSLLHLSTTLLLTTTVLGHNKLVDSLAQDLPSSSSAKVDNSTLEKLLADTEALRGVLARHMVANMEVK